MQVAPQESPMNINQLQQLAMNVVENICSIFTMPVEIILRPQYGSRYFPVPIFFFSAVLMFLLPWFSAAADGLVGMIPFHGEVPRPVGMFGIGSLSSLYFFLVFLHGFRLWRRMIYTHLEDHSEYEGPALPFFYLIPGGGSFWFIRIVIEPAVVFVGSTVLEVLHIFQSGLVTYLHLAALKLAMKEFIAWYRNWEYIRKMLDARFLGPIIAKLLDNTASPDELAKAHFSGFPKNLSADIRRAAAAYMARLFSTAPPTIKDENHA
jgi:hypothetical protein